MTSEEFGRKLRAREVTSAQMTEECLQRIEADNPRLNAFILVMADEARQQARDDSLGEHKNPCVNGTSQLAE